LQIAKSIAVNEKEFWANIKKVEVYASLVDKPEFLAWCEEQAEATPEEFPGRDGESHKEKGKRLYRSFKEKPGVAEAARLILHMRGA
jgi:hypothetical protein